MSVTGGAAGWRGAALKPHRASLQAGGGGLQIIYVGILDRLGSASSALAAMSRRCRVASHDRQCLQTRRVRHQGNGAMVVTVRVTARGPR